LETSHLPVEEIAVGSVRTSKDDEERFAGPAGDLEGFPVIDQPLWF